MKVFFAALAAFTMMAILSPAEAAHHRKHRHFHRTAVVRACDFFCLPGWNSGPFSGARSIHVTMKRGRYYNRHHRATVVAQRDLAIAPTRSSFHRTIPDVGAASSVTNSMEMIGRPTRYIAGRLICAVNVGVALAERGIKGTGSALALSYLRWGRSAGGPVPGAVIVSSRRGGGHVAIVSRVDHGVVYAWNATGGQRGWREIPYRHRVLDYRVPG